MRKLIIGTLSLGIGAALLLYSFPIMTGSVISDSTGTNLLPLFGSVLFLCGLALFFMEARETRKK